MKSGIQLIQQERLRQICMGYDCLTDMVTTTPMELIRAAEAYIQSAEGFAYPEGYQAWAWDKNLFKPKDRKHDLIRAGALIAAALDRINCDWLKDGPQLQYRERFVKVTSDKDVLPIYNIEVFILRRHGATNIYTGPDETSKGRAIGYSLSSFLFRYLSCEEQNVPWISTEEFMAINELLKAENKRKNPFTWGKYEKF